MFKENPIFNEDFRIVEVRIRSMKPYTIPTPFTDATMGPFTQYAIGTIRLEDEDGNYGEVPTFLSQLHFYTNFIFPKLFAKDREEYSTLFNRLYWSIRNEGFRGSVSTALGQLDYALYDLAARRKGVSLSAYVGAKRNWVKAYGCGGSLHFTNEELVNECKNFIDQGFETVKIKVGLNWGKSIDNDVARLENLYKAVGEHIQFAIDANQVWTPEQAATFIEKVKDLNIAWFEEPCHSADLTAIEEICKLSSVPVSYGESEKTGKLFPSLMRAGVQHFQPITGYLSSIDEWFGVMQLAEKNDIKFSTGGYSHMNCQMLAAGNETVWSEFLEPFNTSLEPYLKTYPKIEDGKLVINESIGSAFAVNWEKLEKENLIQFDKTWTITDYKGKVLGVN